MPKPICIRRWLVLVVALLAAGPALAQSNSRNSPEYKEAIRKALQEYELGNWAEAKVFFTDAHALFPNARTLRGLALTTYALRDYVSAIGYFEQALANPVQPLTPELQSGANEFLAQARRFVARVKVNVEPRTASLRIDDVPVTPDSDGTLQLNPGLRELVASAPGYETQSRRWNVEAGARSELNLQLKSENAPAQRPVAANTPAAVSGETAAPPAALEEGESSGGSVAPWVVVGLSGALIIGGGVLLGITASDISEVENAEKYTPWSKVKPAYDRTPALSAIGFSMLGVGVAGLAAGLAWGFWPEEEREVSLRVGPTGVGLMGAF